MATLGRRTVRAHGPMMLIGTPPFWFTLGDLVLASIFLLIFGMTGIRTFAKIIERQWNSV